MTYVRVVLGSLDAVDVRLLAERLIGEDYVPTDVLIDMLEQHAPDHYFINEEETE